MATTPWENADGILVHTHTSRNKKQDKNHDSSGNNSLLLPRKCLPAPQRVLQSPAVRELPVGIALWAPGTCAWPGSAQRFWVPAPTCLQGHLTQNMCDPAASHTFVGDINSREKLNPTEFRESPALGGSHKEQSPSPGPVWDMENPTPNSLLCSPIPHCNI